MRIRASLMYLLISLPAIAGAIEHNDTETVPGATQETVEPEMTEESEARAPEPSAELEAEEPEPIEVPETTVVVPADREGPALAVEPTTPDPEFVGPPEPAPEEPGAGEAADQFVILGHALEPGQLRQFNWQLDTAMAGLAVPMPVLVAHGRKPGPTLCLVAAVHGDELNGVEIVRRIMFDIDLDKLAGNVVGIPIANSFGFLRSSRYLPDRRDLNRYFPGDAEGSMASRFAHALFSEVIQSCGVLVDIHTGSFYRTNLPQIRADLKITRVLHLTKQFGDIAVLHSVGPSGSLRRAATDAGIAAVTMEAGGPARFQEGPVAAGVKAIEALLNHLGMIKRFRLFGEPQPVIYESKWVRAQTGGILLTEVALGASVDQGQRLGTVTDPIQNKREILEAPFRGRLLGMAVNQVVMPGFAAFHIGRVADEKSAIESTAQIGEATDAEHSDDVASVTDEDELFDPSPAATDEPEPEEPAGADSETEAENVEAIRSSDFAEGSGETNVFAQQSAAGLHGIGWLRAKGEDHSRECTRPPLSACSETEPERTWQVPNRRIPRW